MHLVVITSVVVVSPLTQNVFSATQRFDQLLESIRSARSKIVDAFIVVVEGSRYTHEQLLAIENAGTSCIYFTEPFNRMSGEAMSLHSFFTSPLFRELHAKHNFLSVNKLSGRYILLNDFEFYYDGESCVCKVDDPTTSYSGYGMLYTRYYSLPMTYFDQFVAGLGRCCENIFINLEHSFYLYHVLPLEKIHPGITKIHVGGHIAPTGEYVED